MGVISFRSLLKPLIARRRKGGDKMNLDKVFSIIGSIIVLAVISTVLSSKNTTGILGTLFSGFTGTLKAAEGR